MYRVSRRALSVILIVIVAALGMSYYVYRYARHGSAWARAPFNQTIYSRGVLYVGTVTDRNGIVLACESDGRRTFAATPELRRATLHAVGDRDGNIGTGALRAFASELTGYNLLTGSYSLTGERGRTVRLTINSEVNLEAYNALGSRRGAVIVSNYKTGEILCMVSSPGFDPSDPPSDVDDETGIYVNRAIQSAYTPGSTFKLVTAAAAIEEISDIETRVFHCAGEMETGRGTVTCNSVHGTIDFTGALRQSCNIAFGELALELGADTLEEYTLKYGLTQSIAVSGIRTAVGSFEKAGPDTADLAWSGVGQHKNTVCPMAMLRFVGAIANGGSAAQLELLAETGIARIIPDMQTRLMPRPVAARLGEIMEIQNRDSFPGLMLHAKSGTAQVGGDSQPHAWYTGYITNPEHPYAFVVVVENGGGGAAVAGPVANRVLQKLVSG